MVEGKPISIGNIAYVLGTDAKRLNRWYKDYLSGFREAERDGRIYQDDIEVRREGGRKKDQGADPQGVKRRLLYGDR